MSHYLKSLVQACRNRSTGLPLLTLTGAALAIFGIFASNTWAGFSKSVTAYPLKEFTKPISPSTANATAEKVYAQVILLRPHGFEPAEITRRKGKFLMVVLNRGGAWEANYQLDRLAGNKLHEAKVPREKRDWHQVVDLTPGDYVLKETNHPGWICKITVTPQ